MDIVQGEKLLFLGVELRFSFEVFGLLLLALSNDFFKTGQAFSHILVDNVAVGLDKLNLILEYAAPLHNHIV